MATERQFLFVGGEWIKPASSKRIQVINATTEEVLGSVPEGSDEGIDRAVNAARGAFRGSAWAACTPAERGAALGRFADAIEKRAAQLAQSVSLQNGMPITVAEQLESDYGVGVLRYYAGLACGLCAEETRGWFVQPTVFADVGNSSVIAREEIFGPVLSIIRYEDENEAIKIANDSEYGLGGTVWSADSEHATQVARRIESGTVGVNGYLPDLNAPFGGIKASGLGREMGPESVAAYQQLKSIYLTG
jgi:acyl-CoA reductase-like NAD-dependent aldehyde dehydrogenase